MPPRAKTTSSLSSPTSSQLLHPPQCRIQRALIQRQNIVADLLDPPGNTPSVRRADRSQGAQHHQRQRPVQYVRLIHRHRLIPVVCQQEISQRPVGNHQGNNWPVFTASANLSRTPDVTQVLAPVRMQGLGREVSRAQQRQICRRQRATREDHAAGAASDPERGLGGQSQRAQKPRGRRMNSSVPTDHGSCFRRLARALQRDRSHW